MTAIYVVDHAIERAHHRLRIHVAVIRQERADIAQAHGLIIATAIPWQKEPGETGEGWVAEEVAYTVIGVQMSALTCADRPLLYLIAPAVGENDILPVRLRERERQQQRQHQASGLYRAGHPLVTWPLNPQ